MCRIDATGRMSLAILFVSGAFAVPALSAPVIIQQPAAQTVQIGSTATFSVVAPGAATYQWQRNGSNIASAVAPTYTTRALSAQNNGDRYGVTVSGGGVTISSSTAPLRVTGLSLIAGVVGRGWGAVDGPPGQTRFWAPYTLSADAAGYLYMGDWNTVRRLAPTGAVTTLAGESRTCSEVPGTGTTARFCFPLATLPIGNGDILMGDWSGLLWQITPAGTATMVTGAQFGCVSGLTGNASTFYVADMCLGNVLWRVQNGVTSAFATLSSMPGQVSQDGAGNLYVAEGTFIEKVSPTGVVTLLAGGPSPGHADGQGIAASFGCSAMQPSDEYLTAYNGAFGITTLTDGTSYVTDPCNHTVRKVSPTGVVTTFAGTAGQIGSADALGANARFWTPLGVAHDRQGNIYVSDEYNPNVRKITPAARVSTFSGAPVFWGTTDGPGPSARFNGVGGGVALDAAGTLYVSDTGNHTIRRVSPTKIVSTWAGSAGLTGVADGVGGTARFNYPAGIALDVAGTLFVADHYNHTIRSITSAGMVSTLSGTAGTPGTADGPVRQAQFAFPRAMAADSSGALYVSDVNGLRKISNGLVTTLERSTPSFDYGSVEGIAVDSAGLIYLTHVGYHSIYTMTQAGVRTLLAGGGCGGYGPNCFGRIDGPGNAARFMRLRALAIGNDGMVYVSDAYAGRVARVTPSGDVTTVVGDGQWPITSRLGPLPGRLAGGGPIAMLPGQPVSFIMTDGFENTILRVDLP